MNRGSDSIVSVYSDARTEYTKQLCFFLVPAYFQFFVELLEKAKQAMVQEPKKALWQFQNYLNEIHDWNMEKVNNEIHTILVNSGCDYLEDLLTAVFIAHTKVLTAIRLSSNNKKVEINIPKVEHFLFKVLCESSKLLWSSTYLFREGISGIEKQQNYRSIEGILNEGIHQAVRSLVPVKSILKDFINGGDASSVAEPVEEDSDDEDTEKTVPDVTISKPDIPLTTPPEVTLEAPKPVITPVATPIEVPIVEPVAALIATPIAAPIAAPIATSIVTSNATPVIVQESKLNEVLQLPPQTIIIDDKPSVRFGQFDTVFDSEDPQGSDMIFDPKDTDDSIPELMDDSGVSLSAEIDFDQVNNEELGSNDYEEL